MNNVLHTKWGNARINNDGYYVINSGKKVKHGRMLHRLIWEDFYGTEIPEGYVIHHKNGNKQDYCILNLQLMRNKDHRKLHTTGENNPMYNKKHNSETKEKMKKNHWSKNGYKHPKWMKNKKHSEESKRKISESNTKYYFRIIKGGFNKEGKRKYTLISDESKPIKYSISIDKLIKWFNENYLDKELVINV